MKKSLILKFIISLTLLPAMFSVAQNLGPLEGNWSTGFRTYPAQEIGGAVFVAFDLQIENGILTNRVKIAGDIFNGIIGASENKVVSKVFEIKAVKPEPIGPAKIVPDFIYLIKTGTSDYFDTMLDPDDVIKANKDKRCGLDTWVTATPQSIFNTRCVIKGTMPLEEVVPIAVKNGFLYMPLSDIVDTSGSGDENPNDPYEKIDRIRIDLSADGGSPLTIQDINMELPLRRIQ